MATPSKKSAAYEKGLREGRADKNKPSIESEIKPEGEEEEEMGTEEMDGAKSHSRKRSAKGAKNTKPAADGMYGKKPMDAECGCMSKGRKSKCDGSCGKSMKDGGYMKKMDSLTPQEYLTACELGIQNRSRTYIRARLDAAERLDLKCGNGAISEGEKCTKGAAQKVDPNAKYSVKGRAKAEAKSGAIKGALMGAAGGFIAGALTGKPGAGLAQAAAGAGAGALYGAATGAARGAGEAIGNRAGRAFVRNRQNSRKAQTAIAAKNPQWKTEYEKAKAGGASRQELTNLSIKQAGEIDRILQRNSTQVWTNSNRRRRDSVYAAGFSPELDQLAI